MAGLGEVTVTDDLMGALLPGYDVGNEIGRGGWGVVLAGRHKTLERRVAIKQLPMARGSDPEARERFRSEARVVASLDHPHIVPVYDFVEHDTMCVFVMELMTGGTLWDRVSNGGLAPEAACAVSLAMLTALAQAHERGVLHRDVKPENVLFSAGGVPKLADFGIAKVLGDGAGMRTATGMIMGTPAYMAPEQGSGQPIGPATDLYAVGAMLYELLAGRLPFESTGDPLSQLYRHVHETPTPLSELAPNIPHELAAVVMQALAKDPSRRHGDALSFARALDRAASTALGSDWLARSGVPVLGGRHAFADGGDGRPDGAPPAWTPTPASAPPPPGSGAGLGDEPVGRRRRGSVAAKVAVLVAVAVILAGWAILVLPGDDPTEVPRAAEARFRDACRTTGVSDELCTCALDRALAQLSVTEFLANDRLLQGDGVSLTPQVDGIFARCQSEIDEPSTAA